MSCSYSPVLVTI